MSNPSTGGWCTANPYLWSGVSHGGCKSSFSTITVIFFPAHEPWIWFQFSWLCASSIIPDKCCLWMVWGLPCVSRTSVANCRLHPWPSGVQPLAPHSLCGKCQLFCPHSTDTEIYRDTCTNLWVSFYVRKETGKEFGNSSFPPNSGRHQPGSTVWHVFMVTAVGFLLALVWFTRKKMPIALKTGLY